MSHTREKQEVVTEEELEKGKEQLSFLKDIAREKCRSVPTATGKILGTGNDNDLLHNTTFWGIKSRTDCVKASQDVIDKAIECLDLSRKRLNK